MTQMLIVISTIDLLTSESNYFVSVPECAETVNLAQFPAAIYEIWCSQRMHNRWTNACIDNLKTCFQRLTVTEAQNAITRSCERSGKRRRVGQKLSERERTCKKTMERERSKGSWSGTER